MFPPGSLHALVRCNDSFALNRPALLEARSFEFPGRDRCDQRETKLLSARALWVSSIRVGAEVSEAGINHDGRGDCDGAELKTSDVTIFRPWPLTAPARASEAPVEPPVYSTMVLRPGVVHPL